MHPWTHLQRPEGAIGCALLCHFLPTTLRQGDRWTCRSPFLWRLVGQWAPRISLSCPVFNMVSWGTNSAPHACVPDTDSCLQSWQHLSCQSWHKSDGHLHHSGRNAKTRILWLLADNKAFGQHLETHSFQYCSLCFICEINCTLWCGGDLLTAGSPDVSANVAGSHNAFRFFLS